MAQLHDQRKALEWWKLIGRCTVSCITVLLSQYALSLIPRFFSASPFLIQLTLSGPLSLSFTLCIYIKVIGFETLVFFFFVFCRFGFAGGCGIGGKG
jgi:hypothetical protein